jgi:hypothetical protein
MNLKTNKMEDYKVVKSREIVWCHADDRYILIIKDNGDIVGLNYMQGDELGVFMDKFSEVDADLTKFYQATYPYLGGTTELSRINQAIWAYFEYKTLLRRSKTGAYTCDTFKTNK